MFTYVRNEVQDTTITNSSCESKIFVITVEVNGLNVVIVYKPPTMN